MTAATITVLIIGTLVASAFPLVFLPLFRRTRFRREARLHEEVNGRPYDPASLDNQMREMKEQIATLSRILEERTKVAH